MNIGIIPLNAGGCGYYRLFIPMRKMEERFGNYKVSALFTKHVNVTEPHEDIVLRELTDKNDIIVIQRRYGVGWESFAKQVKARGRKLVYEADDCFEGIPLENLKLNAIHMTRNDTRSSVIKMLRLSDLVTVSTPELKTWVCKYVEEERVKILKNTLDFTMWPEPHYGKHKLGTPMVVGFAGSESHKTDLRELGGSLEVVNREVNSPHSTVIKFGFFGFMLKEFWNMHPHVAYKLGVSFLEYPKTLSDLQFQIGLAPLKQCLFNVCKSELRFLEHAACGVPVIATNIAPFTRCINEERGILVKNKDRHWKRAILHLACNRLEREKMGRNSFNYVKENYNIETYVNKWNNVYKELGGI